MSAPESHSSHIDCICFLSQLLSCNPYPLSAYRLYPLQPWSASQTKVKYLNIIHVVWAIRFLSAAAMKLLCYVLLVPFFFAGLQAQCPSPASLVNDAGEKLCARMFEHSNIYFDQSCGGAYLDSKNGDDFPYMPLGWGNKVSSLVVANRCTLKVWSKSGKGGNNRSFNAGVVYQLKDFSNGLFGNWNDAIQSYFCTCT